MVIVGYHPLAAKHATAALDVTMVAFLFTLLTDNQVIYRQYLQSPIWKAKRQKALNYYGPICARCKQHGTDVHHKTYERVGGNERISDLEVLCRGCHETHHQVERASCTHHPSRKRGIHVRAAASYLKPAQMVEIRNKYSIQSHINFYSLLHNAEDCLLQDVAKMLGCDYVYGVKRKHKDKKPESKKRYDLRARNQRIKRTIVIPALVRWLAKIYLLRNRSTVAHVLPWPSLRNLKGQLDTCSLVGKTT